MVFAHADQIDTWTGDEPKAAPLGWPKLNAYDLAPGQLGFGYGLKNEGAGIALNIEHGVEIDGQELPLNGGDRFRALRPGESQPAPEQYPWAVVADQRNIPAEWKSRVYWARFDNVFGERFETRNPTDPTQPAEFNRIEKGH